MENRWPDCNVSPPSGTGSEVSLPNNGRRACGSESAPSLHTSSEGNLFGDSDSTSGGLAAIILPPRGYPLEVTSHMRRVGPPSNWSGPRPNKDCELFCGLIPPDVTETVLIPKFEGFGPLYDFRLFLNSSFNNLGHAFITYEDKRAAKEAVLEMDGHEIKTGHYLDVKICREKIRLYVGNIPKIKSREELYYVFKKTVGDGLLDCITYNSPDELNKNRGFCFLEYNQHQAAILAKKTIMSSGMKYWGCDVIADWADPVLEPDPEIMSRVKILYVRNLSYDVTEYDLWYLFSNSGKLERVKRIKDYAFVHFQRRGGAERALARYDGYWLCGCELEVQWSRPPLDKKDREAVLRARDKRMSILMTTSEPGGYVKLMNRMTSPLKAVEGTASLMDNQNTFYDSQRGDIPQPSGRMDNSPDASRKLQPYSEGTSLKTRYLPGFSVIHRYHNQAFPNESMNSLAMRKEQPSVILGQFGQGPRYSQGDYEDMRESWGKEEGLDANTDDDWRKSRNNIPVLADLREKNTKTTELIPIRDCLTKGPDIGIAQSTSAPITSCHNRMTRDLGISLSPSAPVTSCHPPKIPNVFP